MRQWSNLKQKSKHSSEVTTARVKNVGFVSSTERRFPVNIRLWIFWLLGSNPLPKNESHP